MGGEWEVDLRGFGAFSKLVALTKKVALKKKQPLNPKPCKVVARLLGRWQTNPKLQTKLVEHPHADRSLVWCSPCSH